MFAIVGIVGKLRLRVEVVLGIELDLHYLVLIEMDPRELQSVEAVYLSFLMCEVLLGDVEIVR